MDLTPGPFPTREGVRGAFLAEAIDLFEDLLQLVFDLFVREADDFDPVFPDEPGAFAVVFLLSQMDAAIGFDDQCGGMAVEVCEEAADDLLAAEVPAVQTVGAQALPEHLLGPGHLPAQLLHPPDLRAADLLPDHNITSRHADLSHPPAPSLSGAAREGEQSLPLPFQGRGSGG